MSWNDASGGTATSYIIWRCLTSSGVYSPIATNNSNASTNYTDAAVANWTTYYYEVSAANSSGQSAVSTPPAGALAFGVPAPVTGLTATNGIYSVLLGWSSLGATNFNILRSTTSGAEILITNVNGFAYTNPGTEGTLYYYKVQPVNYFGDGPASTEVSAIPCVAFFTNWIGIFNSPADIGGWATAAGNADAQFFSPGPGYGPSSGCLILDGYYGGGATNSATQGLATNLPGVNLSTYTTLQMDFAEVSGWDGAEQIQAITPQLQCAGINFFGPNTALSRTSRETTGITTFIP